MILKKYFICYTVGNSVRRCIFCILIAFFVDFKSAKLYNTIVWAIIPKIHYQEVGRIMDGDSKPNACSLIKIYADPAVLPTELC